MNPADETARADEARQQVARGSTGHRSLRAQGEIPEARKPISKFQ